MVSVSILASGRGTNLQALIDAEAAGRLGPASIDLVLSDKEDARALQRADRHGIPHAFVDPEGLDREAYDRELVQRLQAAGTDLVVLAGFMRVLSGTFIQAFPNRTLNIHPSLLPSFPGLRAQRAALEEGVRIAGATTHFVTEDVDAGPIVLQSAVPVQPEDSEQTLSDRILETEHRILPASVRLFAQGRLSVSGGRVEIKGQAPAPAAALTVPEVTP